MNNKKFLLASLLATTVLAGCGKQPTPEPTAEPTAQPTVEPTAQPTVEPTPEYTPDLTKNVQLRLAINYDGSNTGIKYNKDEPYRTPKGTEIKKGDFKPVWQSLQNKLNFSAIVDENADAKKSVTYFNENWQTNQYADLACGNVTDIVNFSVLGTSETILDISQYMQYLPNFSKFLEENPIVKQSITTSKFGNADASGIYYFPYFDGFADLEKMTLVRADWVRTLLDSTDVEFDTDTSLAGNAVYTPTVADRAYEVTVPVSMESNETKVIAKKDVKNIIEQQNELIAAGNASSANLVAQYRQYIVDKYGDAFAKKSDLFLGVDSCYDADEMVALMRIVKVSPKALTGNASTKMVAFVPREANNQRIADLYRWAGQLWGVRGVESRSGYFYIDSNNKINDCRADAKLVTMLENLNKLYQEGLIAENFHDQANFGVDNGKYAEKIVVGGNEEYAGFMEYDYSQTQGVWNDKAGSKAIEGYDFRPILGGVSKWDSKSTTGYIHFTESWRSVKSQGLALNAALAQDEDKLMRALALCDYFWSDEGHELNSFGPASEGYVEGTFNYQGREVAKFTQATLDQLNDSNIGKGNYTNYLRQYVGATLPVGYIKEQGMEYQCTSENAKNGLAIINKAIELGTYKHVECKMTEDPFFTIVPSAFPLSSGDAAIITTINDASALGSINSNGSKTAFNIWDDYVMYGFANAEKGTKTTAQYVELINETWKLRQLVNIYQIAYEYMIF